VLEVVIDDAVIAISLYPVMFLTLI
jgi:hypothetical protein